MKRARSPSPPLPKVASIFSLDRGFTRCVKYLLLTAADVRYAMNFARVDRDVACILREDAIWEAWAKRDLPVYYPHSDRLLCMFPVFVGESVAPRWKRFYLWFRVVMRVYQKGFIIDANLIFNYVRSKNPEKICSKDVEYASFDRITFTHIATNEKKSLTFRQFSEITLKWLGTTRNLRTTQRLEMHPERGEISFHFDNVLDESTYPKYVTDILRLLRNALVYRKQEQIWRIPRRETDGFIFL